MHVLDTLASRLSSLITVAGIDLEEVDRLAGLRSEGHTGQIARGAKPTPRAATVTAIARVFGTSAEYLVDGRGEPPGERRVRRAVAEARERLGGSSGHAPTVAPKKRSRKLNGGQAGAARRGNRRPNVREAT